MYGVGVSILCCFFFEMMSPKFALNLQHLHGHPNFVFSCRRISNCFQEKEEMSVEYLKTRISFPFSCSYKCYEFDFIHYGIRYKRTETKEAASC